MEEKVKQTIHSDLVSIKDKVEQKEFVDDLKANDTTTIEKIEGKVERKFRFEQIVFSIFIVLSIAFIAGLYIIPNVGLSVKIGFTGLQILLVFKAIKNILSIRFFLKRIEELRSQVNDDNRTNFYLGLTEGVNKIREDILFVVGMMLIEFLFTLHLVFFNTSN